MRSLPNAGWGKKPIPSVAVRSENLAHYLARYVDGYRRHGHSPREGGGRDEIILIRVCDRLRTTLRMWRIDRFPLTGAVRDLVPVETRSGAETGFAGRFVNLLEGRAACGGAVAIGDLPRHRAKLRPTQG
jgi:hypothetical protein